MFYIFSGDDREKISFEVKKILGEEYEVFEGEKLTAQDLMNICRGTTIFGDKRKILIRDLTPVGKEEESEESEPGIDYYGELLKYLNTVHTIVIWETRLPRRKSFSEFKKAKGVKVSGLKKAFETPKAFQVADLAMVDGKKAVSRLREIEEESDPYMFMGALAKKVCDNYRFSKRDKERLLDLAELDMKMKTSKIEPWRLIEAFIYTINTN